MEAAAVPPAAVTERAATTRPELLRLAAFVPLALYGGVHWGDLLLPSERSPMTLMVVVAVLGALALLSVPPGAGRVRRIAVTSGVSVVVLALALLSAGVSLRLLVPDAWDDLFDGMVQGIGSTPGIRVPYRGLDEWLRIAMLSGGTALIGLAALIGFWPRSGAAHGRHIAAAVALGVLYAVPVIEHGPQAPVLDGIVFAIVLAAFLWLEQLRTDHLGPAVLTLLVAVVVGAIIAPRLDAARPWIDYEALAAKLEPTKAEEFTWNHSYGPLDWSRDGREVLRIKARTALYWKAVNLERFDGVRWSEAPATRDDRSPERPIRRWIENIQVADRGLRSRQFVAAGEILEVLPGSTRGWLPTNNGTAIAARGPLEPGDTYGARVYAPRPSEAQLRRAGQATPTGTPLSELELSVPVAARDRAIADPFSGLPIGDSVDVRFQAFQQGGDAAIVWPSGVATTAGRGGEIIRDGPYARVYALARSLRKDGQSPYEYAQAVLQRVQGGAAYDESPPAARYPLASFLFDERAGYCQQFSGTMAMMLRMGGVPARVASGFSPGAFSNKRREYVVRDTDAHSWVEAYVAPYGWITLDPTPAASPARSQSADTATPGDSGSGGSSGAAPGNAALGQSGDRPFATGDPGARLAAPDAGSPGRTLPLAIGGAVALAALALLARWWRRRPRWHSSGGELAELERALWRTRRLPAPAVTLSSLERLLGGSDAAAAYVRAVRERRFRETGAGPSSAQRRALRRQLGAGLGLRGQLRAWWALPPRITSAAVRRRGRTA